MKKELMIGLLAVGFIAAGVISVSAGTITWTVIETVGMASHQPGADLVVGTSDDSAAGPTRCNYSDATDCVNNGTPTTGSYSFAKLNFVSNSSCTFDWTGHQAGEDCTQNSDCGEGAFAICTDCNTSGTPAKQGLAYFALNPSAPAAKGAGTMTVSACESTWNYTKMSIGTSEVIGVSGGGCMTLTPKAATTSTGCGPGNVSSTTDMDLWTFNPITSAVCGLKAGIMPGINLSGKIFDAGVATSSVCTGSPGGGYDAGEVSGIITDAGLGSDDYLLIMCGNGTLPSNLHSVCLRSATWDSKIIAKTSVDVVTACTDQCGGCMAGTAEGVE